MTFAIVRKEPSAKMLRYGNDALPDKAGKMIYVGAVFRQMLAASEAPDDAELDELFSLWSAARSANGGDREQMKAFLAALGAKHE